MCTPLATLQPLPQALACQILHSASRRGMRCALGTALASPSVAAAEERDAAAILVLTSKGVLVSDDESIACDLF